MPTPVPVPVPVRMHGGTDAQGPAPFDFSSNSNACGPCPATVERVAQADMARYPDASYTALRHTLAAFHGVAVERIALAGSASEFIFRMTALAARRGATCVSVPQHAYGDYAHAANAWGLQTTVEASAHLAWACEPSSPLGGAQSFALPVADAAMRVLDCAYAPLRLRGAPTLDAAQRAQIWQLWSPNKALGLTGLRGAYAVAPEGAQADVEQLGALAPSWVLGAHGVEMLTSWASPQAQAWLAQSLGVLRQWKAAQERMLQSLGWACQPSDANFFCARPPQALDGAALRLQGIKLRDASSFGLPGWVRLSAQPPLAQDALLRALQKTAGA